jgi:hypothetical protein
MTQIDPQPFYRSDSHDDAVLTGPITGLPVGRASTPPTGSPSPYATPHPSSPLPMQSPPPTRRSHGVAIAVLAIAVLGAGLLLVPSTGVFADVALSATAVHQVTYEVSTAKGTRITATYTRSQGDTLTSASVSGTRAPWSASAQVSGALGPTLTASLSPDAGRVNRSDTVTCSIVEDGVQVARESASGEDAMVTCTT